MAKEISNEEQEKVDKMIDRTYGKSKNCIRKIYGTRPRNS